MSAAENEAIVELVAAAIDVVARRMFGGVGLYHAGVFFGLVDDGRLYLRVDATTKPRFVAEGCEAFRPIPDKPSMESYWSAPERVLASKTLLRAWSLDAVKAARERAARKRPTSASKRGERSNASALDESIPNLGPRSLAQLAEIGVTTLDDLRARGSIATFHALAKKGHEPSELVLFAMEAALMGLRRDQLPDAIEERLRAELAREKPIARAPRGRGRR